MYNISVNAELSNYYGYKEVDKSSKSRTFCNCSSVNRDDEEERYIRVANEIFKYKDGEWCDTGVECDDYIIVQSGHSKWTITVVGNIIYYLCEDEYGLVQFQNVVNGKYNCMETVSDGRITYVVVLAYDEDGNTYFTYLNCKDATFHHLPTKTCSDIYYVSNDRLAFVSKTEMEIYKFGDTCEKTTKIYSGENEIEAISCLTEVKDGVIYSCISFKSNPSNNHLGLLTIVDEKSYTWKYTEVVLFGNKKFNPIYIESMDYGSHSNLLIINDDYDVFCSSNESAAWYFVTNDVKSAKFLISKDSVKIGVVTYNGKSYELTSDDLIDWNSYNKPLLYSSLKETEVVVERNCYRVIINVTDSNDLPYDDYLVHIQTKNSMAIEYSDGENTRIANISEGKDTVIKVSGQFKFIYEVDDLNSDDL